MTACSSLRTAYWLTCILLMTACQSQPATAPNPPATGFNEAASDTKAIEIADQVMEAMGGREAWDQTRYLRWTFFGRRHLIWDRYSKRVRIEVPQDSLVYLFSYAKGYNSRTFKNGIEYTAPDSILRYTEQARRIWINDSYWLVMPFKLKDSGVTLTYLREDSTKLFEPSHVLQLTFDGVGVTPQNKYEVWVDKEAHLVRQWAFYADVSEAEPRFVLPWLNYEQHEGILLSSDRGPRDLTDIDAPKNLPNEVFTEL